MDGLRGSEQTSKPSGSESLQPGNDCSFGRGKGQSSRLEPNHPSEADLGRESNGADCMFDLLHTVPLLAEDECVKVQRLAGPVSACNPRRSGAAGPQTPNPARTLHALRQPAGRLDAKQGHPAGVLAGKLLPAHAARGRRLRFRFVADMQSALQFSLIH